MTPFYIIGLQSAFSTIIFSLLAVQYLLPHLKTLDRREAVVPLLWINTFRYLPLILFAPGQVSSQINESVTSVIAYGDLLSCLLALIAVLMITYKIQGGMLVAWLFLVIGIIDSINGVFTAISAQAYNYSLGVSWIVVTFFVPLIFVTEGLMLHLLLRNRITKQAYQQKI